MSPHLQACHGDHRVLAPLMLGVPLLLLELIRLNPALSMSLIVTFCATSAQIHQRHRVTVMVCPVFRICHWPPWSTSHPLVPPA
ncbi:MAG: hypothetical protein IPK34_12825 [Ramlibacter sp.]|nr:hypothetical protein [Ramlibacter sp.]